jgi:membrane dipeptidase
MLLAAIVLLSVTVGADGPDVAQKERAQELVRQFPLVDGHVDVPYRLQESWEDVTRATTKGDFDYPRARQGGLDVPFMSIYTPAEMEEKGGSFELANRLIDHVEAMTARAPDRFMRVTAVADVEKAFRSGKIGLAMGMENGSPLEGKLENIGWFHDRGIRYITLAHSLSNHISDSSYDDERQWNGLSAFGRDVVVEMNRVGVMVDISHVSDEAFWQVLEVSKAPVIASHSSARHFTPDFERNMSDEMIKSLADAGGVIMINFGSSFVTEAANRWYTEMDEKRDAWLESSGVGEDSPEAEAFSDEYREQNPLPYATLAEVADHFDHVVGLAGIDHVGIGSDFDGVGDSLPVDLKDVSGYPNLVAELLRREYSEADIAKILGGNLLRVWRAVEAEAAR